MQVFFVLQYVQVGLGQEKTISSRKVTSVDRPVSFWPWPTKSERTKQLWRSCGGGGDGNVLIFSGGEENMPRFLYNPPGLPQWPFQLFTLSILILNEVRHNILLKSKEIQEFSSIPYSQTVSSGPSTFQVVLLYMNVVPRSTMNTNGETEN